MKKYQIIVVDPPWPIKKLTRRARPNQITMDYKTLPLSAIECLNIESLADDNSWCFLWTIQKYLFESKGILEKWGFNYLLMMTWRKLYGKSSGMPLKGFRWNSEFVAVGYKGKKELWPKRKLIPTAFDGINIRHSQKPDEFYKLIEPLGDTRIDVFARQQRTGWDVWGNEVESDIVL